MRALVSLILAADSSITLPSVYKAIDKHPSVFRKEAGNGNRKIVVLLNV